MERLLHYVWKYKLYVATPLTTTDGRLLQVIDPGIQNTDAGPDFFNAKIKIDGHSGPEVWKYMIRLQTGYCMVMTRTELMIP